MKKIRIGIIFGGKSREREISFAGGRTVYDNLNKSIFEAIPVFVDSFGNFVLLNWEFIYKGSIRDFYPPVDFIPANNHEFQLYAEQINLSAENQKLEMLAKLGQLIQPNEFKNHFDFAFLCLHGPNGEDGRLQGLFEYLQIPYSGSGILPSAIGINKSIQKKLMVNAGFNSPPFLSVERKDWLNGKCKEIFQKCKQEIGLPMVIKPANQGSSVGVTILQSDSEIEFMAAVEKAFFTQWIDAKNWLSKSDHEKTEFIKHLTDIREGIGLPVLADKQYISEPVELIQFLNDYLKKNNGVVLESCDGESTVLIEGFIEGKEFSCIVLEDENGQAIALPPTEIRKGKELFDYRSKYLPGLSRKITPIDLPEEDIQNIRGECERLFKELAFDVYARIDGFYSKSGKLFLNDPNTTSGMMPSSFFFHQAAEIGLNPSQFLTYIIRTSIAKRIRDSKHPGLFEGLLSQLDENILQDKSTTSSKIKVAVILGGYSSERHISVESGRNIYEKLSSSAKYSPIPVFLTGNSENHLLYQIPINVLLKDNADDIKEKIENYTVHPIIKKIIAACSFITDKYSSADAVAKPKSISYNDLPKLCDAVFIALHGRPGEDGAVQQKLDALHIPYNGSGVISSSTTIDKYKTNEILKQNGFLVARHMLVSEADWLAGKNEILNKLSEEIKFPLIAKPVDDGCSSAVKKIKNVTEFEAFAELMFRKTENLIQPAADILHIKPKEEFPIKPVILVEELISKNNAKHFLEVTGGMLTKFNQKGEIEYEVFEASEALVEGDVLSLEEKFLAGQGQNITPARYSKNQSDRQKISDQVKETLKAAAKVLNVTGYCRIDAFVRIFDDCKTEVIFIEVNSLPGMTPATCIFHQAAINNYKPLDFIDKILEFGIQRQKISA